MPSQTCSNCLTANGAMATVCFFCGKILQYSSHIERRNRGLNPRPLHYKCNALPLSYPAKEKPYKDNT